MKPEALVWKTTNLTFGLWACVSVIIIQEVDIQRIDRGLSSFYLKDDLNLLMWLVKTTGWSVVSFFFLFFCLCARMRACLCARVLACAHVCEW